MFQKLLVIFALLTVTLLMVQAEGGPECFTEACNFADFNETDNPTEPEVREACRSVQSTMKCYARNLENCLPVGHPLYEMRSIIRSNLALFNVCERADLYTKFQVANACGNLIEAQENTTHPGQAFMACVDDIPSVIKSPVVNALLQQSQTQVGTDKINLAAFIASVQAGFCCMTHKFAECALKTVRQACTPEAATLSQDVMNAFLGASNCPSMQSSATCIV